jgi:hypothetical protein
MPVPFAADLGGVAMNPVREGQRIYVEIPAELAAPIEGGVFAALLTHQLGKGGCMLRGAERIHPGRVVKVTLNLDGVRISAISQVLYEYEDNGMILSGVKFLDLEPIYEMILDEFIARRLRDVGPEGLRAASLTLSSGGVRE